MGYVESVTVRPRSVTIRTGSWYYGARAEVYPPDADCTDVEWYSSNSSIASVNAFSGYIYGRNPGTTRIYAEATDGSGIGDYITVTVQNYIEVDTVTLDRNRVYLEKGQSLTLTATVCPENATNQTICWQSANTSIAEVTDGVVTAKKSGYTYIYAKATDGSDVSANCCVYVTENILVSSVTVNPSSKTMRVGTSDFLHATVCPEDATDNCVVWSSSNPGVATVISDSGLVFAYSVGQTTIRATPRDGGTDAGECELTVEPAIPVEGVSLYPTSLTMCVGDTERAFQTISPPEATNKRVTWRSSDEDVASVNYYTGEITANSAGTATITATTVDGEFTADCTVSVKIERVTIEKDGYYSKVVFNDGKIWKCNKFHYDAEFESNVPDDAQRAAHNASIDFSEKQLGFLFRIDPNGVIYYVKHKILDDTTSSVDYLLYRDNIFVEIYGQQPRYFTYEDSRLEYKTGIDENTRYSVYSEAELIFGMLPRWTLQNISQVVKDVFLLVIKILIPELNCVLLTYNIMIGYFFTGAVDGTVSEAAIDFIDNAILPNYDTKLGKMLDWGVGIVDLIPSLIESVLPPDIDGAQVSIYENAYENESYLIKISDTNQTVDLNEFIEHYKSLISE